MAMATEVSFSGLLSQLSEAHEKDLQSLRDKCTDVVVSQSNEYSQHLATMSAEIQSLRKRLGEAYECDGTIKVVPLGNFQGKLGSGTTHSSLLSDDSRVSVSGISSARVKHTLRPGWSRQAIWGTDDVTMAKVTRSALHELSSYPSVMMHLEARVNSCFGCERGVLFPHSHFRTFWDLVSLLLIISDVLMLPFLLAFAPAPTTALEVFEWFSLIFWTLDMFQGPFMGYFWHGEYITSRSLVVLHYLKTWFVVDILVVFPEWFIVIMGSDEGSNMNALAGMGKVVKSIRVVRVLRLLRLAKIKRLVEVIYDMSKDEYSFVLLSVLQLISFVLVLNHLIACAWYAVGNSAYSQGDTSWLFLVEADDAETTTYYLYLTSMHWSLTQFTPAAMKYSATNANERLFSIIVLFFALVVFSSFVGSITSSITRLRSLRIDSTKQLWFLRRFLREFEVSENLSQRIYKFVEHKLWQEQGQIHVSELDVTKKLSKALSDELAYDMHAKALCIHPFFSCLSDEMEVVVHRLCRTALQVSNTAKDELVFSAGDEGKHMYFVQSGELEYTCVGSDSNAIKVQAKLPPASDCADDGCERWEPVRWLAEAVLWVAWRHRGKLVVGPSQPSELIVLNPQVFFDLMTKHPRSWLYAVIYGERFVEYLNGLAMLTDVIIDDAFYSDAASDANWLASNPWAAGGTDPGTGYDKREAGKTEENIADGAEEQSEKEVTEVKIAEEKQTEELYEI